MPQPKILCFAGSLRAQSFNKQLARHAAELARAAGATVTYVDLRDFPMPIYDGDLEERDGIPTPAKQLKQLFKEHDGLLIASPEYNSSISGAQKNAIDWCSRPEPGEPPLVCFRGKVALLLAASPGALGGLRGLVTVRSILSSIGVLVLPDQLAVGQAHQAFDADGRLKDEKQRATLERIVRGLVTTTARLCGG